MEINRIALAWIELNLLSVDAEGHARESLSWVMDSIDDIIRSDGSLAWRVIDEVRRINGSDRILANLAAGPLEDFLVIHGESHISRIEEAAKNDPQLRKLLGATWKNQMSEELWARIRSVSTNSW